MHTEIALKIFSAVRAGMIKTNAHFFKEYCSIDKINSIKINTINDEMFLKENRWNLVCFFDDNFPKFNIKLKNSEKPFLFAYKGNINLINNQNNIAVVGTTNPTLEIINREKNIVKELINKEFCIVSGLARGCDTIAHKECLNKNGKTIAFLPTTLDNIYPKENKNLAEDIVKNGGLVITEYITETNNKYENIKRFIDRDRLQALFSKAVILVASNSQGNGDSGSRHAMNKAKEYGKEQFVMLDQLDKGNPLFQLNEEYINLGAKALTKQLITEIKSENTYWFRWYFS